MNAWMSLDPRRWRQVCCAGLIAASVLAAQTEPSMDKQGHQRQPAKVFYAPKPIQPMPYLPP